MFSEMLTYQADTQNMWKYLCKSPTFSSVKAIKNVCMSVNHGKMTFTAHSTY